jgi:mRNA interferase HigB
MHVISRKALRAFWQREKEAEVPLDTWYKTASKATWQNLVEIQADYPHADLVGVLVIFNIGGNKYRLAVKIEFEKQLIFVKYVMTHKEYDKIFC